MTHNPPPSVGILGLGASVPERVMSNFDLEKMVDTSDEWIRTRTGIRERRIVSDGQATSDLGAKAAREALDKAGLTPKDIDLVICCTYSPDEPMPSAACRIQHAIGAGEAAAFDLNAACSGFVYGLTTAKSMIQTGVARHALVVGADVNSAFVDWTDRATCCIFGDGAGAAVIGPVPEGKGILGEMLAADGSGGDLIIVPGGGSRNPAKPATVGNHSHYIKMSGNEVFKFAVRILGPAVEGALEKAGLSVEDIDYIAPHQANIRIIEAAAKRFGVGMDRVLHNIERYGNTTAGTIPLVLYEAEKEGKFEDGAVIAMVAFGAGMTWGASIVKWGT